MIKVLIADDQAIIREGLQVILNADPRITVIGVAADGAEALEQAARDLPDVVLMDLKMPVMNGIRATQLFKERHPGVAVLVLTTYDDEEWVVDAIRAGAAGYLLKESGRAELVAAIEGTAAGRHYLDPAVGKTVFEIVRHGAPPRPPQGSDLNERELAILQLLASGLSNAAIGERLSLAEGTVRNHVTTIFAKLDVSDRAQATAYAWRHGLVER
jgi:DNA-binding NarL/FixJ family response regulator